MWEVARGRTVNEKFCGEKAPSSNELALGCIAKITTQRGGLGLGGQGSVKKMADSVSPPKPKITT